MIVPLPSETYNFFQSVAADLISENVLPFNENTAIIAGVSGGVDSMLMLAFLEYLQKSIPFHLITAHLNHGLRPVAADRDQKTVEAYCRQSGIEFHAKSVDVLALSLERKKGVEEAGRKARYDFFRQLGTEILADGKGQSYLVCLAHHEQDQAETILLNLGRGSGLEGLIGMQIIMDGIIRPFLRRSKGEIIKAAEAAEIPWQEDHTNIEGDYRRNRLRNELLPLWTQILSYDASPLLGRLSQNLLADAAALQTEAKSLYQKALLPDGSLSTKILLSAPEAITIRTLNIGLRELISRRDDNVMTGQKHTLSREESLMILRLCRADEATLYSLDLAANVRIEVFANTLNFL